MAESKASSRRILAAERRIRALELRKAGNTFAQIGQALGVTEQRAHRIVTAQLVRLNAHRAEAAGEVVRLELERLDALHAAVWPKIGDGDPEILNAVLRVMARRAKLLGLDAPTKTESKVEFSSLSDSELSAEAEKLGIPLPPSLEGRENAHAGN